MNNVFSESMTYIYRIARITVQTISFRFPRREMHNIYVQTGARPEEFKSHDRGGSMNNMIGYAYHMIIILSLYVWGMIRVIVVYMQHHHQSRQTDLIVY